MFRVRVRGWGVHYAKETASERQKYKDACLSVF